MIEQVALAFGAAPAGERVELGDRATSVAADLAAIEHEPALRSGFLSSMTRMSDDLYLVSDDAMRIELMVKDSWVALLVGPPAKYAPVLDDLAILIGAL
ncbi:hypothetical protein B4Q13_20985 [Lacticaseibacillus rhamnosus]